MNNDIEKTIYLLDCFESVSGCSIIWKATTKMQVEFSLPERHRRHNCPFCRKVKGQSRASELQCMDNDIGKISRRALKQRSPFLNICHAGVAELVVPVFDGDHYLGAVLCGPFRSPETECLLTDVEKEYDALQFVDDFRVDALVEVITRLIKDAPLIMESSRYHSDEPFDVYMVDDARISRAIEYIQKNFHRHISADELARVCSLSRSRFQHLFKEQVRMSFSSYISLMRLKEARRLLTGTRLQMSEIAEACGFNDQSRFAALFKRYYHSTPVAYRRLQKLEHQS